MALYRKGTDAIGMQQIPSFTDMRPTSATYRYMT